MTIWLLLLHSIGGFPVAHKLPSPSYKHSCTLLISAPSTLDKTLPSNSTKSLSVSRSMDKKKPLATRSASWETARLFREGFHPQFPELCMKPEDPRGERQRRLAESEITVEQAESACKFEGCACHQGLCFDISDH